MRGIEIIYEDEDLIVANKPAGLVAVPDGFNPNDPNLVASLEPVFGAVWIVHRLDKDTSGAIVVARNEAAHRALSMQFEQHDVAKVYHCIVRSSPEWQTRTVNAPLRVNADRNHHTLVDHNGGKPSVTHFEVLQRLGRYCLLVAKPETGRTHQIRVHAQFLNHPIACDFAYGDGKPIVLSEVKKGYRTGAHEERPLMDRLALHAATLEITHPKTNETMQFEAPYPKDFRATVAQLGKLAKT